MIYYLVLTIATAAYAILAFAVWKRSNQIAFLLGLAFFYYWTLLGGWFIVYDLRGGNSGMEYQYLFYKMFPVHLDLDYFWTLVLYAAFLLTIEIVLLVLVRRKRREVRADPVFISHGLMLAMMGVAALISYLIVRNSFATAAEFGQSGYEFVRSDQSISRWYTIHQLLNRTSLFALMIGLGVYFAGRDARYIAGLKRRWHLLGYLGLIGGLFLMNLFLGDRQELVSSFFAGGLFYLANDRRPKKFLIAAALGIAAVGIGIVGLTRGHSVGQAVSNLGVSGTLTQSLLSSLMSNEPFAAHMSMYGVLHKGVPITYGSSFIALGASVIPRAIWANRPQDIYTYYSNMVGALEGQGYSIHHATAWYLNFGVAGILIGAGLLAWAWAKLWNNFCDNVFAGSHLNRLFRTLAFWTFTASLFGLIRNGPEGYKTVLMDLAFPTLVVLVAGLRAVMRYNRPLVVTQRVRPAPIGFVTMRSTDALRSE